MPNDRTLLFLVNNFNPEFNVKVIQMEQKSSKFNTWNVQMLIDPLNKLNIILLSLKPSSLLIMDLYPPKVIVLSLSPWIIVLLVNLDFSFNFFLSTLLLSFKYTLLGFHLFVWLFVRLLCISIVAWGYLTVNHMSLKKKKIISEHPIG